MTHEFAMPTLHSQSVILQEDGVHILDRRVFPFEKRFVICRTHDDVAAAIETMVTQSNGPFFAAGGGMVLSARAAQALSSAKRMTCLEAAAARLLKTRPTNNNIATAIGGVLRYCRDTQCDSPTFAADIEDLIRRGWTQRRDDIRNVGRNAASVISDGAGLMTFCWSEGAIMETLACLLRDGKSVTLYCPETRPYLQGARLTAHSAAEMGIDTVVMTDGMGAHAMAEGRVTMLMTAADRVTMSGHVINKVGTLQSAIAARHFRIPYFATVLKPDIKAPTPDCVEMEERDPNETLHCLGQRTASPLARGWYPAFDVTPPELVSGIATKFGVFPAAALMAVLGPRLEEAAPQL